MCLTYKPVLLVFTQIKMVSAAVGPDEYDAVVTLTPELSTQCLAGDLRTGRQLLADAAFDLSRPLTALNSCQYGRAELASMATAIEALAKRL
jgi:hypothetical protein